MAGKFRRQPSVAHADASADNQNTLRAGPRGPLLLEDLIIRCRYGD